MSAVAFRRGSPRDRAALEGLLSGLSPDSAYARFQTAFGSGPPPAVLDALLPDGALGGALLAWDGSELVAHGLWVRLGQSRAAEIALVVTDGHQGRGIGTALADRLVGAAATWGIERIEVFSEARKPRGRADGRPPCADRRAGAGRGDGELRLRARGRFSARSCCPATRPAGP